MKEAGAGTAYYGNEPLPPPRTTSVRQPGADLAQVAGQGFRSDQVGQRCALVGMAQPFVTNDPIPLVGNKNAAILSFPKLPRTHRQERFCFRAHNRFR